MNFFYIMIYIQVIIFRELIIRVGRQKKKTYWAFSWIFIFFFFYIIFIEIHDALLCSLIWFNLSDFSNFQIVSVTILDRINSCR